MKKFLSSILISFILFINFILPVSLFAADPDILSVVSYTGPQDESVTFTDPMEFSVVFDAPQIPREVDQPNKNYNVFFQATCVYLDGTTKDMPKGGDESGAHYIISNQSKFIAGQKMSLESRWTWRFSAADMTSGCPTSPNAPSGVIWTLRENNTDGSFTKEYLRKTFKFKAMRSFKLPGFYYVTTDISGDYKVSNILSTQLLCDNDSASFIRDNPNYKLFKPCEYYDDLPIFHKQNTAVSFDPKAIGVAQNKTVYQLLAPLPGITCMDWSGNNTSGCIGNNVGDYLNIVFKLAIGICAALAVIMLIINGITYMGDESIFAKTEAKSKMFSAVLGLLIALGSWALLNTISPALTGKGGVNISTANVTITPLYDRGYDDPKQANGESTRCTPVTNPSSPCTPDKLEKIFPGKGIQMSKICNMESGGNSIQSGTDVCKPDNNSFSFGLFQVNLSANGTLASTPGLDCSNLFNKAVIGADAIIPKYTSGYTCNLLPGKLDTYNACKARLLDTTTNLAIAKSLFNNSKGMGNWNGDKKFCASAFQ